ncbi:MAG: TatD family hydrolase [Bacteroidota bacterium]|nr:TatD family hydrolase [Bacteroidota bacterium]
MILIDTHAHLYLEEFDHDRETVIQNAIRSGVQHILCPNIDSTSLSALDELCGSYPGLCHPMMGLHPTSVKENYKTELEIIRKRLFDSPDGTYVAVGEIGMDLYWDKTFINQQEEAFAIQLEWALAKKLPVVIHSRDSFDEIMGVLQNYNSLTGVFHCFSGNVEQATQLVEKGYLFGIGGVVTFKNSGLDKVVQAMDLSNLVLETDSPYLTPVPYRGKRNESAYISMVAQKISQLKDIPYADVCRITTENAIKLFNLPTSRG